MQEVQINVHHFEAFCVVPEVLAGLLIGACVNLLTLALFALEGEF